MIPKCAWNLNAMSLSNFIIFFLGIDGLVWAVFVIGPLYFGHSILEADSISLLFLFENGTH